MNLESLRDRCRQDQRSHEIHQFVVLILIRVLRKAPVTSPPHLHCLPAYTYLRASLGKACVCRGTYRGACLGGRYLVTTDSTQFAVALNVTPLVSISFQGGAPVISYRLEGKPFSLNRTHAQ